MKNNFKTQIAPNIIPGLFILLAVSVSLVSTVHSFDFFTLTNKSWMSAFLAVTFEIGQLAALGAIVSKNRLNMQIVWALMITLTSFQIMANIYYSFAHLDPGYIVWSEMFGTIEMEVIQQKRLISAISGGFLPLLSLGFTKALADYLKGQKKVDETVQNNSSQIGITIIENFDNIQDWLSSPDYNSEDFETGDQILLKNTGEIWIHSGNPDDFVKIKENNPIVNEQDVEIKIDNSKLHKIPDLIIYDKSTDKFNQMLNDPTLLGRLQNYNLKELDNLEEDQKLSVLSKTPKLLSLVWKQYQDEQKILKGRKNP